MTRVGALLTVGGFVVGLMLAYFLVSGSSQRTSDVTFPTGAVIRAVLLCALVAALLWPAAGLAREVVWCHEVRAGESLSALARRYQTTIARLRRLNGLGPRAVLRAGTRLALPTLERLREGRVLLTGPSLRAAPGNLLRENHAADRQRLSRIGDRRTLRRFVRAGLLIPMPAVTRTYRVSGVPATLRVARPWTKRFVEQLAAGLHELFGRPLKVTSLTRTAVVQRRLARVNGNAAPAEGVRRSTHLTGAAVDLSARDLSAREVAWLHQVLRRLATRRLLLAIEEFQQSHFHVLVFRNYLRYARTLRSPILIGGC